MGKWRPSNWANPYTTGVRVHRIYEAGADAMLEALRNNRITSLDVSYMSKSGSPEHFDINKEMIDFAFRGGRLVFIPDDKET